MMTVLRLERTASASTKRYLSVQLLDHFRRSKLWGKTTGYKLIPRAHLSLLSLFGSVVSFLFPF